MRLDLPVLSSPQTQIRTAQGRLVICSDVLLLLWLLSNDLARVGCIWKDGYRAFVPVAMMEILLEFLFRVCRHQGSIPKRGLWSADIVGSVVDRGE